MIPFFDSHEVKLLRMLTDRGSEYCGNPERHEYELYLAIEDIDHSRTKTKSPQTNGICERFHKTVLNEFYRVAFRKKVYRSIDEQTVWKVRVMGFSRVFGCGLGHDTYFRSRPQPDAAFARVGGRLRWR